MTTKAQNLRQLLNSKESLVAPGAFDCVSARLIEKTGFHAVYMTGFGVSASLIGKPDIGLVTLPEMAGQAGNIATSIDIPLIADADTGYGNELNVARTIEFYERNGIAAIQLEDQGFPKKCGHMEEKTLISKEEATLKIRAAIKARNNPDTVIIARTDARTVLGLEEALERAKAYADAGADILFVESPLSVEEMEHISHELKGISLMANMVEGGKTPLLSKEELQKLRYKLIIWPITPLLAITRAIEQQLVLLKENGISNYNLDEFYSFTQFTDLLGLPSYKNFSKSLLNHK